MGKNFVEAGGNRFPDMVHAIAMTFNARPEDDPEILPRTGPTHRCLQNQHRYEHTRAASASAEAH